jgi:hypothetical protein
MPVVLSGNPGVWPKNPVVLAGKSGLAAEIKRVLHRPQLVRRSRTDATVRMFYEFYARTVIGGKWLCVVVKYAEDDAFVVTAYLTDKPKAGEDLWPIK